MPRPKKTLLELVEDGTFLSRQDHERLADPDEPVLRWKTLSRLQDTYRGADSEPERRRIGIEFEKAIPKLNRKRASVSKSLDEVLEQLGPAGSAERTINFFPRFFRWDDGKRFKLDEHQQAFIREMHRRDEQGRRVYKDILLGIERGEGKTPLATGIGIETMLTTRSRGYQIAGAEHQAQLALQQYAKPWIEQGDLRNWCRAAAGKVTTKDGRGSFTVMSASGSLAHGRKGFGLVDEWWALTTPTQEQTQVALESQLHKELEAYLLQISTAGHSKETQLGRAFDSAFKLPIVETFREGFLTIAKDPENGRLVWWYGMPEGYELDLENDAAVLHALELARPGSWTDHRELLRMLRRAMQKGEHLEWLRLQLNAWTRIRDAWFSTGLWARLRVEEKIPAGGEIFVAIDASLKYDTTAVAWAYRLPNGRILVNVKVWSARKQITPTDPQPYHEYMAGGRIRHEVVEDFIANELATKFKVREVVYDPRFFDSQGVRLADAGLRVAEFPQNSGLMRDAYQHMYEAVGAGTIVHNGDRVFTSHVEGTAAVLTSSGWYVYKLQNWNPIDALVAATMARERCARGKKKRGSKVVSWR